MKVLGSFFIALAAIMVVVGIWAMVDEGYQWSNGYESYWTLSDRSSTLQAKSGYIDQFVTALQGAGFNGEYDALWLKTPENSCDTNVAAVVSLQSRLHNALNMDESSMAYQQEIQQITAQEQGDAGDMMNTLNDCYDKVHWYWLWNPIAGLFYLLGLIVFGIMGLVFVLAD